MAKTGLDASTTLVFAALQVTEANRQDMLRSMQERADEAKRLQQEEQKQAVRRQMQQQVSTAPTHENRDQRVVSQRRSGR